MYIRILLTRNVGWAIFALESRESGEDETDGGDDNKHAGDDGNNLGPGSWQGITKHA